MIFFLLLVAVVFTLVSSTSPDIVPPSSIPGGPVVTSALPIAADTSPDTYAVNPPSPVAPLLENGSRSSCSTAGFIPSLVPAEQPGMQKYHNKSGNYTLLLPKHYSVIECNGPGVANRVGIFSYTELSANSSCNFGWEQDDSSFCDYLPFPDITVTLELSSEKRDDQYYFSQFEPVAGFTPRKVVVAEHVAYAYLSVSEHALYGATMDLILHVLSQDSTSYLRIEYVPTGSLQSIVGSLNLLDE